MQGHNSFLERNMVGYWHTRMTEEKNQMAMEATGKRKKKKKKII